MTEESVHISEVSGLQVYTVLGERKGVLISGVSLERGSTVYSDQLDPIPLVGLCQR